MSVNEVLLQAKALSLDERNELVKTLIDLNAEEDKRPKLSLRELRGIAAGILEGGDAQAYVDELRDEWDRER